MFTEKSDKLVAKLVKAEYRNAVKQYGKTYKEKPAAWAVLRKEICEVCDEIDNFDVFFNNESLSEIMSRIEQRAKNAMKKLAQVCAVCRKIKASEPAWERE